ncbi:MAG: VanZ family protein [Ignavibacteriaceae bacterium]
MYNKLNKYRVFLLYSVLIVYSFIILILPSIVPGEIILSNPIDKFLHFIAYGILSFILYFALYFQNSISILKKYPAIFTVLLVSVFGMLDELRQYYMMSRTANILDWLANFLGSLLTVLVIKSTIYLIKKYNNP